MDAGIGDALSYAAFAALGAAGAAIVLDALFRPVVRKPGARSRSPFRASADIQQRPLPMSDQPQSIDHDVLEAARADVPTGEGATVAKGAINQYPLLANPHIKLAGPVDHAMYASFCDQLSAAPRDGAIVIAISTLGGDPEVARLMGDEVRLLHEAEGRELLFLGKVAVYSAGATFMSAFPVDKRFLTRGTRLMLHERIMNKTVEVNGPLKTCVAVLKATLHEIEHSIAIEEEGFRRIVAGSRVDFDELVRRAPENWYIEADEAKEKGLVLDVV